MHDQFFEDGTRSWRLSIQPSIEWAAFMLNARPAACPVFRLIAQLATMGQSIAPVDILRAWGVFRA